MRICFVCLGNICRSPAAEATLVALAAGRTDVPTLVVESAGTGPWHVGDPPHDSTVIEAQRRGVALDHVGQQFGPADFDRFDLLVAMDHGNVKDLEEMAPDAEARSRIVRLGSFAPGPDGSRWAGAEGRDVPDPYGRPQEAFATMFDQVEVACRGLLDWIADGNAI
ncbi:MAG: low molecular weight protein-tyrosine-phosphatase [Ornithinimicrobium sp.]